MFQMIKNVLTPPEILEVRQIAGRVKFMDGKASNPHSQAKNNLQMDISQPEAQHASQIAGAAVARNAEFQNIVFPKRIASLLLCRYDKEMNYGSHADSPIIPLPNGPLRSDVSGTLFIADPASYEGGELTVHLGTETLRIKGEPGSLIVYPSTTLHEVTPTALSEDRVAWSRYCRLDERGWSDGGERIQLASCPAWDGPGSGFLLYAVGGRVARAVRIAR